jgi:pimeloyl-ACP methyl ester carboxylesterase
MPKIETRSIAANGASIAVRECGSGAAVVMVPSWARGASDFDALLVALADAGFHGIALSLRGIEGSTGSYAGGTLRTMAADVAAVIEARGGRAHVIGHALGNGVARCVATDHPALVKSVILLAAGGRVPAPAGALEALERALARPLDDADWLAAMRESGFFARSFDPMRWRGGWWTDAAHDHVTAFKATPAEHWWNAGSAPLLVVQGLEDKPAVPENGHMIQRELGTRVTLVDLADAAHALLPEQPAAIAKAVIAFLRAQDAR